MNEREMAHSLKIDISMYDARGVFTPAALMKLTVNMIEEHLDTLGIGEKALMQQLGISWVLLNNYMEFSRPLSPDDRLTARTWHSGGHAPLYRRDYEITDGSGETVVRGATYSTLFDVEKRRICTDREKLSSVALNPGDQLVRVDRLFRYSDKDGFSGCDCFRVRPSMLDGIGHVNNTRYGEFVWDAMTAEERAAWARPASMGVWYLAELHEGEEVCVEKLLTGDGDLVFRGLSDGNTSFGMKFRTAK